MTTIKEDYCSFDIAKLLKEKGFDGYCFAFHKEQDKYTTHPNSVHFAPTLINNECLLDTSVIICPTLSMAMKWLREVHHTVLVIDYDYECTDKSYCYKVYRLGENGKPEIVPIYGARDDIEGRQHRVLVSVRDYERSCFEYAKYEEACEAAIKYCLENLI